MELIDPQPFECPLVDGGTKTYMLGKFTAIAGREIVTKYPLSNLPKVGDYQVSEDVMLKLMSHVGITRTDGQIIPLRTRELVNNHVPDFETLARIEMEMLKRNVSFFRDGRTSVFFGGIAQAIQQLTSQTLTASLAQFLKAEKLPSENSPPSTP